MASLTARLAAAERALTARDKTIQVLVSREKDRTAKRASTFGVFEENAGLQQVVASKTLELEQQNRKLEQTTYALRETSGLLEMLLENIPSHIYFKDKKSRFVRFSKSVQNTFNPSGDVDLTGRTDLDFYDEPSARETLADEQAIIHSGEAIIGKTERLRYADGRIAWSLITKMPWRDKDGCIIGTFGISTDLTAIKAAEAELEAAHKQVVATSHQAGMAEVATGVLHNVGNVLNSVNVSATLVSDQVRRSKIPNVGKLADLLHQHRAGLGDYLTDDPKGKIIPAYLMTLKEDLAKEQSLILAELDSLHKNIGHIKDIVAMQQSYAKTSGVVETISVPDLIEDAIRMNAGSLARHDVDVAREYHVRPVVTLEKNKVLQILVNLVRNAKYACDESGRPDKLLTIRITSDARYVTITVSDNGVGIPPENLTRIFAHGFTTRKQGHGFGLHSGALAAKELGGSLSAHSDGLNHGATFTLKLPYKQESAS
ncbi:MAG: PAS domain-containing sensor histidine kinase [Opitutaceae bacterium]